MSGDWEDDFGSDWDEAGEDPGEGGDWDEAGDDPFAGEDPPGADDPDDLDAADRARRRSRWTGFPASQPIPSDQGIRARSQRGGFAKHWWASRWIQALEAFMDPGRLQRGRRYARAGQVLALEELRAAVEARVQGSRKAPYRVRIALTPLSDAAWERVALALAESADYAATLLAGAMPEDIEEAFEAAGVSLFPRGAEELDLSCSCPDASRICKHIAAAHFLLGERFDADPWLLFRLRGRDREALTAALRAQAEAGGADPGDPATPDGVLEAAAGPLEEMLDCFWIAGRGLARFGTQLRPPALPHIVLQRLGQPDFMDADIARVLGPAYAAISTGALALGGGSGDGEANGGGGDQLPGEAAPPADQ